jgi:hypothetical protein
VGYELHIHRADEWYRSGQRPVTADEWLAVVAADPELRIDGQNGRYFAVWPGACRYPGGTWFDWYEGRVFTKNPDRVTLIKMLELARRLRARVQGTTGVLHPAGGSAERGENRRVRPPFAAAVVALLVRAGQAHPSSPWNRRPPSV